MDQPELLHFTDSPEANALLAGDPLALLIGFVLDQQVPLQKAFVGPYELQRRLGSLDAKAIAGMDPGRLETIFRERPALHRFPGTMARRTQDLCSAIAEQYRGDTRLLWSEAEDAHDLERRLADLPGFGPMKVQSLLAVLANRFGLALAGLEELLPRHPTIGDVDSREALLEYQAKKRARKSALKARDASS